MENKINKKLAEFIQTMKKNIKTEIIELFDEKFNNSNDEKIQLLKFIEDYDILQLDKDDFTKRKRSKNVVPQYERCLANRANSQQCTRRKKKDCDFCGTHMKSQPYGISNEQKDIVDTFKKITVYTKEIEGIIYYLDDFGNIYDPNDIMSNMKNPRIVLKYTVETITNELGETIKKYSIPSIQDNVQNQSKK